MLSRKSNSISLKNSLGIPLVHSEELFLLVKCAKLRCSEVWTPSLEPSFFFQPELEELTAVSCSSWIEWNVAQCASQAAQMRFKVPLSPLDFFPAKECIMSTQPQQNHSSSKPTFSNAQPTNIYSQCFKITKSTIQTQEVENQSLFTKK